MAEQRVTDDVLDHWASEVAKEPPGKLGSIDLPAVVEMLIAEVRAARAREAEAKARIVEVDAALRQMAQAFHRVLAKWDVLQQRIDKALVWLPAPGVAGDADAIRAALTGTETS